MFSKFKQLAYQFSSKHKDIFYKISGHEDIKWLLTSALNSEQPVHILLDDETVVQWNSKNNLLGERLVILNNILRQINEERKRIKK